MRKKLMKSKTDRKLAGVCGGLATYFNIDATIVRLVFALGAILGFGSLFVIYVVLWLVLPEETPSDYYRTTAKQADGEQVSNKTW
ncbi:PspC domain-containing protein [Brochothrix campestris]|uniref:Phage shock protein PspC n=1 Tax=Brochothrix campestris FSL F6-1037 TaxID=1265861 RepID=W7CKN2_9LIST|nr:PspC domain-containing protein [Brochothrix campestris]EUJ40009.1 phage shock protein PspC [Brochothrix campestris FSL F6-1037]